VLYKPVKSDEQFIEIKSETGHIIKFKVIPRVFVDLDNKNSKPPFFFCEFGFDYIETVNEKKHMSLKKITKLVIDREINKYWKAREFDIS